MGEFYSPSAEGIPHYHDHELCSAWLRWAFRSIAPENPNHTHIAVFETSSNFPNAYYFNGEESSDGSADSLMSIIGKPATSRVIVLAHEGYRKLNKTVLSIIRTYYTVDEDFLFNHFFWDSRGDYKDTTKEPFAPYPESLPSSVKFLSLDYDGQITVMEIDPTVGSSLEDTAGRRHFWSF